VSVIFCRACRCCLNAHICSTIEIINGIMYWTLGMSMIPLRLVDPMSNFSNRNGAAYNVSSVSVSLSCLLTRRFKSKPYSNNGFGFRENLIIVLRTHCTADQYLSSLRRSKILVTILVLVLSHTAQITIQHSGLC
jgi:hypothetical protein